MAETIKNKGLITLFIMLAAIMEIIDSTIANVALPSMQGSLGASQEQASWILTSYIVASAVAMPITGWLTGSIGAKRLLVACTFWFTLSSVLCGLAQSLMFLIIFNCWRLRLILSIARFV